MRSLLRDAVDIAHEIDTTGSEFLYIDMLEFIAASPGDIPKTAEISKSRRPIFSVGPELGYR